MSLLHRSRLAYGRLPVSLRRRSMSSNFPSKILIVPPSNLKLEVDLDPPLHLLPLSTRFPAPSFISPSPLSSLPSSPSTSTTFTSTSLLDALTRMETQTSSSSSPLKFLALARPLLAQISQLDIDDYPATKAIVQLLFARAENDLGLFYEFSEWLVTVPTTTTTPAEPSTSRRSLHDRLVRRTVSHLLDAVSDPTAFPPASSAYRTLPISTFLTFCTKHQAIMNPVWPLRDLLRTLVEMSSKEFVASTKTLWRFNTLPPPAIASQLDRMRKELLERTREVERGLREADWAEEARTSPRFLGSLMQAYNRAGSFEDVERIWKRLEGVELKELDRGRADSIFFDACGFSGSLSTAITSFSSIHASSSSSNRPVPLNTWLSYQESLIRCGAFEEYVASLQLQLSSSSTDASLAPLSSLHVGPLTKSIKLAHKLADFPHTCTLNPVDGEMVEDLRRKVREVVGDEKWVQVEDLLLSPSRDVEIEMPEIVKGKPRVVLEREDPTSKNASSSSEPSTTPTTPPLTSTLALSPIITTKSPTLPSSKPVLGRPLPPRPTSDSRPPSSSSPPTSFPPNTVDGIPFEAYIPRPSNPSGSGSDVEEQWAKLSPEEKELAEIETRLSESRTGGVKLKKKEKEGLWRRKGELLRSLGLVMTEEQTQVHLPAKDVSSSHTTNSTTVVSSKSSATSKSRKTPRS